MPGGRDFTIGANAEFGKIIRVRHEVTPVSCSGLQYFALDGHHEW